MPYCSGIGCNNRSTENRRKGKSTEEVKGWHVVPYEDSKKELRSKWLQAMKRDPPYPKNPNNFVICGQHFEDSCFERNLKAEYGFGKRIFSLVENSVPSIFSFTISAKKRVLSEDRINRRSRSVKLTEILNPELTPSTSKVLPQGNHRLIPIVDFDYEPTVNSSSDESMHSSKDADYLVEEEEFVEDVPTGPSSLQQFLVVDWDLLQSLMRRCPTCGQISRISHVSTKGSMLKVEISCDIHTTYWASQESKESISVGNMQMSAGILLSGLTFESIKRFMQISGIQFLGRSAFFDLQRRFLFPAINSVYIKQRNEILNETKDKCLDIIGDGRFDSPGSSAKYGTRTH